MRQVQVKTLTVKREPTRTDPLPLDPATLMWSARSGVSTSERCAPRSVTAEATLSSPSGSCIARQRRDTRGY